MAQIAFIRIPVRDSDSMIVARVDPARARWMLQAPNATGVFKGVKKRGFKRTHELVGIQLASTGDCASIPRAFGNPLKMTFLSKSDLMPSGVFTLKHLDSSTQDLYCTVRTECLKEAA